MTIPSVELSLGFCGASYAFVKATIGLCVAVRRNQINLLLLPLCFQIVVFFF